jgi:GNAT superfamily N-acetyltransferase
MQSKDDCGGKQRDEMPAVAKQGEVKIRRARRGDATSLAELSGQLGYPATGAQVAKRLGKLAPASQHALFVAQAKVAGSNRGAAGGLIGWLHVSVANLVEVDTRAEVNGLVVAEGQRSLGAGARLLEAAEEWARRHGCGSVNLRSNVIRERAHKFYERQGYEHYKTQKAFRKRL